MMDERIALLDLDGTVADYDEGLRQKMNLIRNPGEPEYHGRYEQPNQDLIHRTEYKEEPEPPHMEARRKLIQAQPGFWRNLAPLRAGFAVVNALRDIGFIIHVLTKGPARNSQAWAEKVDWCAENLPYALVTITHDKSTVYGRVLVDDYPPYFTEWLKVRPRGLVLCVAQSWNLGYARGGGMEHPNVLRVNHVRNAREDGEIYQRLQMAYDRLGGGT